jgi:hypothetical protein
VEEALNPPADKTQDQLIACLKTHFDFELTTIRIDRPAVDFVQQISPAWA